MNYDWKDIFNQAERFNKASMILNQEDNDLKIVSFTNAAFAIELYYKSLYVKTTGEDPSKANHNIITIFNNLSQDLQDKIKDNYYSEQKKRNNLSEQVRLLKTHFPDFCTDFIWNLEQVKSAFLGFRYVYEKGKTAAIVFYPELRASIIRQLLD